MAGFAAVCSNVVSATTFLEMNIISSWLFFLQVPF